MGAYEDEIRECEERADWMIPKPAGKVEKVAQDNKVDMVNHPPHYSSSRGPKIQIGEMPKGESQRRAMDWLKYTVEYGRKVFIEVECIEVIRWIPDMRLATAIKYVWRVAFGGKEPGNNAKDQEDIQKAIWYLNDYLGNPLKFGTGNTEKVEKK